MVFILHVEVHPSDSQVTEWGDSCWRKTASNPAAENAAEGCWAEQNETDRPRPVVIQCICSACQSHLSWPWLFQEQVEAISKGLTEYWLDNEHTQCTDECSGHSVDSFLHKLRNHLWTSLMIGLWNGWVTRLRPPKTQSVSFSESPQTCSLTV